MLSKNSFGFRFPFVAFASAVGIVSSLAASMLIGGVV